jgi:tetratricopeptide (TPR) repeat protein
MLLLFTLPAMGEEAGRFARLMEEGRASVDRQDYATALELFEEAFRINPSSKGAVFNTAYCLLRLERLEEALDRFQAYMAMNPGTAKVKKAKLFASQIEEQLLADRARVEVASTPAGARIELDGAPLADERSTPATLWLSPGQHTIRLTLPGYRSASKKLTVVAGDVLAHNVALAPPPEEPVRRVESIPADAPGYAGPWTTIGVGGTALGAGIVLVALAWKDYGDYEETRDGSLHDRAKDEELAGWILGAAGAAAVAGGVIWLVAAGSDAPAPRATFHLSPAPNGAVAGFSAAF